MYRDPLAGPIDMYYACSLDYPGSVMWQHALVPHIFSVKLRSRARVG